MIMKRKKRRIRKARISLTLTIKVKTMVNVVSDNYLFKAHGRLRSDSSSQTILACYLSRSINEFVKLHLIVITLTQRGMASYFSQ